MQRRWKGYLVVLGLVATAPALAAQDSLLAPPGDTSFVVDRVIAVVGNRPILGSQVEEELFALQAKPGVKFPPESDTAAMAALRRQTIRELIDQELLVQRAQKDTTIKVTEEEIAEGVAIQMRGIRSKFTSEAEYRAELQKAGFQTPDEYRRWFADHHRRSALQNRLLDRLQLKPVPPTDAEMRAYFDAQKAAWGRQPALISFRQIVVTPKASVEAKERARKLADSIATELRKSGDFGVAARRFSADSGSAAQGGDLGWVRRGMMVPEFERVVFALKPGTISAPVETPFGFHVIQVQRVQPTDVLTRHILIVPDVDSTRIESARALADSIYRLAKAGASFDSLQQIYHDPSAERAVENTQVDSLPKVYGAAIGAADSGVVVPAFILPGPRHRPQFVVVQVARRRLAGDVRYEDLRDRIYGQLSREMAIRQYIDALKSATYVEVRP